MTTRPIFSRIDDEPYVKETIVSFTWVPGQHYGRRQLCALALHEAAAAHVGNEPILEVSTYSTSELGRALSAMNLRFTKGPWAGLSVEHVYQASKIFTYGGPFVDLLNVKDPRRAKGDMRLKASGDLIGFELHGVQHGLDTGSYVYDLIYAEALHQHDDLKREAAAYRHFSDIAFNPKTMLATQARSVAHAYSRLIAVDRSRESKHALCIPTATINAHEAQLTLF